MFHQPSKSSLNPRERHRERKSGRNCATIFQHGWLWVRDHPSEITRRYRRRVFSLLAMPGNLRHNSIADGGKVPILWHYTAGKAWGLLEITGEVCRIFIPVEAFFPWNYLVANDRAVKKQHKPLWGAFIPPLPVLMLSSSSRWFRSTALRSFPSLEHTYITFIHPFFDHFWL